MAQKTEAIGIRGLVVSPNDMAAPEASFAAVENCVFRRPGVLETLVNPNELGTLGEDRLTLASFTNEATDPSDTYVLRVSSLPPETFGTRAVWYTPTNLVAGGDVTDTVTVGASTRAVNFDVGQIHLAQSRGRYILTERHSPIVFDDPTEDGRLAGLPVPAALDVTTFSTTDTPAIPKPYVAYACLFFRQFSDGYEYRGAPTSSMLVLGSLTDPWQASLKVYWSKSNTPLQAGDRIEIYRTKSEDTAEAISYELYLTTTYIVTSTDISNGYSDTIVDAVLEDNLGAALYTNEFQDGAARANYMPPPSVDVLTYREATLYASTQGWTSTTLTIQGTFGTSLASSTTEYAHGIGERVYTMTTASLISPVATVTSTTGVYVGQEIVSPGLFAAGTRVVSFVANTSITFSANPLIVGTATTALTDILIVNGKRIRTLTLSEMQKLLATQDSGVVLIPLVNRIQTSGIVDRVAFALQNPIPGDPTFTLSGTNPQNYSPPLTDAVITASLRPNRVYFSRVQQPESVPLLNWFEVGNGAIVRMAPTQSAVLVWCTDGLFRVTGDGVSFRVDAVDSQAQLLNPDMLTWGEGSIFAWITGGLFRFSDGGAAPFSDDIIAALRPLAPRLGNGGTATLLPGNGMVFDRYQREIWVYIQDGTLAGFATSDGPSIFVYNLNSQQWTTVTAGEEALYSFVYAPGHRSVFGWMFDGLKAYLPPDVASTLSKTQDYGPAGGITNPIHLRMSDVQQWQSLAVEFESESSVLDGRETHTVFTPGFVQTTASGTGTPRTITVTGTETNVLTETIPVPRNVAGFTNFIRFAFQVDNDTGNSIDGFAAVKAISLTYRTRAEQVKR